MKTAISILIAGLLALPQIVIADSPESLAIESQLYETELLIKAMEAADAIPVAPNQESDVARQKYRVRDCLDELTMISYKRMDSLLRTAPNDKWAHKLTKSQWAERLITHFLDHHIGSANEGWALMPQIYMHDKDLTINLLNRLQRYQQDRLIADLRSPLNKFRTDACKEFAASLDGLR